MHNGATFAIVLAFAAAKAGDSFAQERHGPSTLTTHSLKGGADWVEGGRANTGFIIDDKGVIVFDAQMTQEDVQKELAEIARITPKRVDQIVIKPPERMRTIGSGRNNWERQSSRRHYQTWQFEAPDAALISPFFPRPHACRYQGVIADAILPSFEFDATPIHFATQ